MQSMNGQKGQTTSFYISTILDPATQLLHESEELCILNFLIIPEK